MSKHASGSVGAQGIETTIWRIDPERSSVEFQAKTFWGTATVRGHFARYHGTLHLSGTPAVVLTIEAAASTRTTPSATRTSARRTSSTSSSTRTSDSSPTAPRSTTSGSSRRRPPPARHDLQPDGHAARAEHTHRQRPADR